MQVLPWSKAMETSPQSQLWPTLSSIISNVCVAVITVGVPSCFLLVYQIKTEISALSFEIRTLNSTGAKVNKDIEKFEEHLSQMERRVLILEQQRK